MSWQTLVAAQKVRSHSTSRRELDDLRAVVERDLADAAISKLSAGRHFATAYAAFTVYFDTCRRKRNTVDYDRAHVATETEASEILNQAKDFLQMTEAWILRNHPLLKKT